MQSRLGLPSLSAYRVKYSCNYNGRGGIFTAIGGIFTAIGKIFTNLRKFGQKI